MDLPPPEETSSRSSTSSPTSTTASSTTPGLAHQRWKQPDEKEKKSYCLHFIHKIVSTSSCLCLSPCSAILYHWPDSSLENCTGREKQYKSLLQQWRGMILRFCSFCKPTILFKAHTNIKPKRLSLETTTMNARICICKRKGQQSVAMANHKHQIVT